MLQRAPHPFVSQGKTLGTNTWKLQLPKINFTGVGPCQTLDLNPSHVTPHSDILLIPHLTKTTLSSVSSSTAHGTSRSRVSRPPPHLHTPQQQCEVWPPAALSQRRLSTNHLHRRGHDDRHGLRLLAFIHHGSYMSSVRCMCHLIVVIC